MTFAFSVACGALLGEYEPTFVAGGTDASEVDSASGADVLGTGPTPPVAEGMSDGAIGMGDALTEATTSYRETVLADNPLGYWRLGESPGDGGSPPAFDETTFGHNGIYVATAAAPPQLGVAGAIAHDPNTAVAFDGVDNWVQLTNDFAFVGRAPFSIEAWVKPTAAALAIPSGHHVFTHEQRASRDGYALWMGQYPSPNATDLCFERLVANTSNIQACAAIAADVFSYAVGTYDGNLQKIYINGVLLQSTTNTDGLNPLSIPSLIGSSSYNGAVWLGTIDEVAVYGTALSVDTIVRHYQVGAGMAGHR